MDWEQIEKDFIDVAIEEPIGINSIQAKHIVYWFRHLIEKGIPAPPILTEEEKSEFYTTDLTANVKVNYEK